MDWFKYTLLFAICFFLSACATLNKSECKNADWEIIGLEDGSRGRAVSYIKNHRKACAEHGVSPDLSLYQIGHAAGLTQFCTAEVGFSQGKRGHGYNGVCPSELRSDFLYGYDKGRELYLLNREISQIHNTIGKDISLLEGMQTEINELELKLIAKAGSSAERLVMLQELKKQQTSHAKLENEIHNLELDEARLQGEYDLLNSQHGF
jgi:hypothetical protein